MYISEVYECEVNKMKRDLEVIKEVKEDLESNVRGKFIGGEYIFRVFLKDGHYFTNYDYFKHNDISNLVRNLGTEYPISVLGIRLDIDEDGLNQILQQRMNTSSSFIRVSSDAKRDYQNRIISEINKVDKIVKMINETLQTISSLNDTDKTILTLHGIMGISYRNLSPILMRTSETLRRSYLDALEHLSIMYGLMP